MAITASSSNYSVSMFGTGMAASNVSSTNYEATSLSEAKGTTRNAESGTRTANIGFFDNTIYYRTVSITSYSIYPESAVQGSIIRLSISALNSQSVWAVLALPSGSEESISLTNNGETYYTADSVGVYTVTFYANNSQGNIASVIDTFEITSPIVLPIAPPSSGGGGTTKVIEKCTYIWDCTSWSICSGGEQQRACKNIGNCTGIDGKPIETRECSDVLFDVSINLKEVELTKNETLKFSVGLIEKKGIEKIDVQIKYSIINSNNTETFSQIETKAIQGNLSFEKEIKEIRLIEGEYILRVDILYGNLQRAFAEQKFRVIDGKIEIGEPEEPESKFPYDLFILCLIGIGSLIFILLLIYFIIRISRMRKKNYLRQKLEEGFKSISKGDITGARLAYENIKGAYKPNRDANREIYNKIMEFYNRILKSRAIMVFTGFIGAIVLVFVLLRLNIENIGGVIGTGKVIDNIASYNSSRILIFLIIISVLASIIIFRKKFNLIYKKIIEFLSEIANKHKKYPLNSVRGLRGKKVYSENGDYVGKVSEAILGENKIESLKIKIDKRHKFKTKGIIVNYRHVKNVGEVIIIDEKLLNA